MKTIAIVDPYWTGHHPSYFMRFCECALRLGYRVRGFCPAPEEVMDRLAVAPGTEGFAVHRLTVRASAGTLDRLPRLRAVVGAWNLWRATAEAIARTDSRQPPDLVFLAWLDDYLQPFLIPFLLNRVFRHEWCGLYFHPRHLRLKSRHEDLRRGLLSREKPLESSRCIGVGVLDGGITGRLQTLVGKATVVLPDTADTSPPDLDYPLAKLVRARANGRKVVGLLGSIDSRKGLRMLLEVARRVNAADWFFVVAGVLAEHSFAPRDLEAIRNEAVEPPENVLFHFGWIANESQFNALVDACDVIFAAYEEFPHSSNMLAKAAFFKKPIIVSKGFWMEEQVVKYRIGLAIESGSVAACTAALGSVKTIGDAMLADYERFSRDHSPDAFCAAFAQLVEMGGARTKMEAGRQRRLPGSSCVHRSSWRTSRAHRRA